MRFVGRVIALLSAGMVLAAAAGTIAARGVKQRIVPLDDPEGDEIRLVAVFEPLQFRSTARAFRGGNIDCWYGGGIVDLRDAVLDAGGAAIRVRAIFGGAQLVVPETWQVTTRVVGIGGIGDGRARTERPADAPHLTIEGMAVFGGFGVTSDIPDEAMQGLKAAVERKARKGAGPPAASEAAALS